MAYWDFLAFFRAYVAWAWVWVLVGLFFFNERRRVGVVGWMEGLVSWDYGDGVM